jgi:hypothetical protein
MAAYSAPTGAETAGRDCGQRLRATTTTIPYALRRAWTASKAEVTLYMCPHTLLLYTTALGLLLLYRMHSVERGPQVKLYIYFSKDGNFRSTLYIYSSNDGNFRTIPYELRRAWTASKADNAAAAARA